MKKILSIFSIALFMSCTTTTINEQGVYIKADEMNFNKIETLEIKDKMNFINDEINLYHINNLNLKYNPIMYLDIDITEAKSDGVIAYNVEGNNLLVSFKNIDDEFEVYYKKIPFLRVPKNANLNVKLANEIKISGGKFDVVKEELEDYTYYILEPVFENNQSLEIVRNKEFEPVKTDVPKYKENIVVEYNIKNIIGDKEYNKYIKEISEGQILKGKAQKEAIVLVSDGENEYFVKPDENGEFKFFRQNEKVIYLKAKLNGQWSKTATINFEGDKNE